MALQHTSKLPVQVYRELKREIGFKTYLEYVRGDLLDCFKSFVWVPMGCLRSWVGYDKGSGSQECPNCGACKGSIEHVLLSVHHMIPRD